MKRAPVLLLLALLAAGCGEEGSSGGDPGATPGATKLALDRWSQTDVPGFEQTSGKVAAGVATSTYRSTGRTGGGATLLVKVTLGPCEPSTCSALLPDPSRDHMRLREHLNRKHASNPKLVWDAGPIELAGGRRGLYLYTRSYMEERDGGGTRRLAAHFFQAWYHDGRRLVDFAVEARGGARVTSDAILAAQMTPEEAQDAVRTVFAAFAGAFAP